MSKLFASIPPFVFILICTALEVTGDALLRKSMYEYSGAARAGLMVLAALLLFGYGFSLNLAPVAFGQVVGMYIATLFVMWQLITFITFRQVPSPAILIGGALIVTGGLIVHFSKSSV